jgi:2-methylcitrate dehydratase PrpD
MTKDGTIILDEIQEINVSQLTHGMYIKDTPVDVDSYYKACQFNLPYIAAVTLLDGEVTEAQFTSERIADERIHELAKKVNITADESLDSIYPDRDRPTLVEVIFEEGRALKRAISSPYGDPRNNLNDDALFEKFVKWSGQSISSRQASDIKEVVWALEDQVDLEILMGLLRN